MNKRIRHVIGLLGVITIISLLYIYICNGYNVTDKTRIKIAEKIEKAAVDVGIQAPKKFGLDCIAEKHLALEQAFKEAKTGDIGKISSEIAENINFWRDQMAEQIIFSNWQPKTESDHLLLNMVADFSQSNRARYLYQKKSFEQTAIAAGTLCETDLWILLKGLMHHADSELDDLLLVQDSGRLLYDTLRYLDEQLEDVRQDVAQTELLKDQKEALHLFRTISTAKPDLSLPKVTFSAAPNVAPLKMQKVRLKNSAFANHLDDAKWMTAYFNESRERRQLLSDISQLLVKHSDEVLRYLLIKLDEYENIDLVDPTFFHTLTRNLIISERALPWIMSFAEKSPKHAAFAARLILDKLRYVTEQQSVCVRDLLMNAEKSGIQDTKQLKALLVKRMLNMPNLSWLKAKQLGALKQAMSSRADRFDHAFDIAKYWHGGDIDQLFLQALNSKPSPYISNLVRFIKRHQGRQYFFSPDTFEDPDAYQAFIDCIKKFGDCEDDHVGSTSTAALGAIPSSEAEKLLFERLNHDRVSIVQGAIQGLRERYIRMDEGKSSFREQSFLTAENKALFIQRLVSLMSTRSDGQLAREIAHTFYWWPDESIFNQVLPNIHQADPEMVKELFDYLTPPTARFRAAFDRTSCDAVLKLVQNKTDHSVQQYAIQLLGCIQDVRAERLLLAYFQIGDKILKTVACKVLQKRFLKSGFDYYQRGDFQSGHYEIFYNLLKKYCLEEQTEDLGVAALHAIRHYALDDVRVLLKSLTKDCQKALSVKGDTITLGEKKVLRMDAKSWLRTLKFAGYHHTKGLSAKEFISYASEKFESQYPGFLGFMMRTNGTELEALFKLSTARDEVLAFKEALAALLMQSTKDRYQILEDCIASSRDMRKVMAVVDFVGKQSDDLAAESLMSLFDIFPSTMTCGKPTLLYDRRRLKDECIDARRTWSPRLAILHRLFDRKTDTVKAFMTRVSADKKYRKEVQALAQRYLSK